MDKKYYFFQIILLQEYKKADGLVGYECKWK